MCHARRRSGSRGRAQTPRRGNRRCRNPATRSARPRRSAAAAARRCTPSTAHQCSRQRNPRRQKNRRRRRGSAKRMPPTLLRRVLPVSLEPAGLSRAASWAGIASEVVAGANTRIPLSLILGLIYAESRGYPNAKSGPVTDWFSSFGLMQVRGEPWVARGHTIPELFDARVNIAEGLRIFEEKLAAKGGDVAAAVSAYNGGGRRYPAGTRFCQVWREGT